MVRFLLLSLCLFWGCSFSFAQIYVEASQAMNIAHVHLDSNIMGGGVACFDFNNDGYEDIYMTGGTNRDQLFENNQNGSFSEVGISAGLSITGPAKTVGVTTGDIDNDGDRDLFVTTTEDHNNLLFLNNGNNTFTDISISAGIIDSSWSTSASFGDINKDGFLDIYVSNYVNYYSLPFYNFLISGILNKLYLNNGDNTFTDATTSYNALNNGGALATAFTDFDNDNDMDILIGNDFGVLYGGNALLSNDYPAATYTDISSSSGMDQEINAMGIAIGDYDEDLDLDYYITNMMGNLLHTSNNNGTFNQDAIGAGVSAGNTVSWGTFFIDYDHDSYLDLFVASGGVMSVAPPQLNELFQNQQSGTFTSVGLAEGITDTCRSRGAAYSDLDNDGDLDLVVVNTDFDTLLAKNASVYRNDMVSINNWLKVDLTGTISNRDAFGSHIRLVANGRSWIREIGGGSSYLSQNSSIAHFGLGTTLLIDSIIVIWPSGYAQIETNINANQVVSIVEDDFTELQNNENMGGIIVYPNPANSIISFAIPNYLDVNLIELRTIQGEVIASFKPSSTSEVFINTKDLPNGIYYLNFKCHEGWWNKKISIVH